MPQVKRCLVAGCENSLIANGARKYCLWCAARIKKEIKDRSRHLSRRSRTPQEEMLKGARNRAKDKGLPINIKIRDIVVPTHCPLLGIPLASAKGNGGPKHNSPSLDKIIPALGYVKGNIQVISYKANVMKSNATLEEMETLVRNWKAQGITQSPIGAAA
jgi:hypothetical protein